MSGLSCYQRMLDNDKLQQCNRHWNQSLTILQNVTSYTFYCDAQHEKTVQLET